jgi:hypothetical protein
MLCWVGHRLYFLIEVNRREVSLLLKSTTGAYLIIPSMADVDQNCDFLLRIFSQDTTLGRTFVNIFADHDHVETGRRNLKHQHTLSKELPSKRSLISGG